MKEDKIVIETDLPRITSKIEPLAYPVTIIPQEVEEPEETTTTEVKPGMNVQLEEFLLSLTDKPMLLGAIIIGIASIISIIIVSIVFIIRK